LKRNPKLIRITLLLLLTALAGSGLWYVFKTPGLSPMVIDVYAPPRLSPDEQTHDLGVVKMDDKVYHTYVLYNTGGKSLQIKKVDASCGCTVVKVENNLVPPGGFTRLKVTLDTSIKLGPVKKTITVYSNDPESPKTDLFLTANVIADMKKVHDGKVAVKDPLVLFKGECATCHVNKGVGKTGMALFQADCAMCHGLNAQGAVAGALTDTDLNDPKEQARLRKIISEGAPHTPTMPPFSKKHGGPLTDAEIDSLVNYLKFEATQPKETE
jgi:mono/diheme cytochrome c family protein